MQALEHPTQVEKDFLPLNGTDHVEFYVGNARQAAYFYRSAFGFRLAAYRGPWRFYALAAVLGHDSVLSAPRGRRMRLSEP